MISIFQNLPPPQTHGKIWVPTPKSPKPKSCTPSLQVIMLSELVDIDPLPNFHVNCCNCLLNKGGIVGLGNAWDIKKKTKPTNS